MDISAAQLVIGGSHPKLFDRGTQRVLAPHETLAAIRPHLPRVGVTRLANITHLDRLGIPVALAIRPNSRSIVTSAGKGLSLTAALTSAAMEAIELYHAEAVANAVTFSSSHDLDSTSAISSNLLPIGKCAFFDERRPYHWVLSWDLLADHGAFIPLATVAMADARIRAPESWTFQVSSNGLASGNNFAEALAAALYEVIERDAVTCERLSWLRGSTPRVLDLSTVDSPDVSALAASIRNARAELAVFDCTSDVRIPTYTAWIWEKDSPGGLAEGHGTHLETEIALLRAITEAAQSRVVGIAGSRDNIFSREFRRIRAQDTTALGQALSQISLQDAVPVGYNAHAHATFEEDIDRILLQLRAAVQHVFVVELTQSWMPGAVVKVLVPELEGPMIGNYRSGARGERMSRSEARGSS
jgi:ribosomal protein S12 methylthiotransferase accessory factor